VTFPDSLSSAPTDPVPDRAPILRAAVGIGLYAGAFGATFGALAVGAGLSLAQAMMLSLVMFTGASQFAFVGVIAAGGAPAAGMVSALLLGARNAFYGVPVTEILRPRGFKRLVTAHLVIDETTAMAVAQRTARSRRFAFWCTGLILCAFWNVGTLVGGIAGSAIDPAGFGLDAAAPAVFLALLWPQVRGRVELVVAVIAAGASVALIPVAPAGVPVIAAALVAVVAGIVDRPAVQPAPTRAEAVESADEAS
jgi:4-azaleucine resistance transporter AzlC